jgi:hypothetical protein
VVRCLALKNHFSKLKDILSGIQHLDCRILEDHVRARLITELVQWYLDNCGALDTKDVLRKGWKGFEYMDDMELIEDWLETLQLDSQSYSNEEFELMECAEDIETAIDLKLKLAKNILAS